MILLQPFYKSGPKPPRPITEAVDVTEVYGLLDRDLTICQVHNINIEDLQP